jgi:hypothetical protein
MLIEKPSYSLPVGWTKEELGELGILWPPTKGWKKRLEQTAAGRVALAKVELKRWRRITREPNKAAYRGKGGTDAT